MLYQLTASDFICLLDADKFEYKDICIVFAKDDLKVIIENTGFLELSMCYKDSYERKSNVVCSSSTCLAAFRVAKQLVEDINNIGFSVRTEFYDKDDSGDYRQRLGPLLGFQPRLGLKSWIRLGK